MPVQYRLCNEGDKARLIVAITTAILLRCTSLLKLPMSHSVHPPHVVHAHAATSVVRTFLVSGRSGDKKRGGGFTTMGTDIRKTAAGAAGTSRIRLTRRQGLVLSGAAAVLAACGGGKKESSRGTTPTGGTAAQAIATQEAPRRGGILKAKMAEPTHFDASRDASAYVIEIGSVMYSCLLRIDPQKLPKERVIIGDLAEKWELTEDGAQYIFHLRKGVTWHDGRPFSAQDVVATLQRARLVHPARDLFKVVQSVTAPDSATVVVTLSQPVSYFLSLIAHVTSVILPAHILATSDESLKTQPVGTGPFKFVSWDHNVSVKLTRNDQYFLPGLPYVDGREYVLLPDAQAEVNALRSGQIDISSQFLGISAQDVRILQSSVPGVQAFPTLSSVIYTLFLNNTAPPFNNPIVREAVSLVIDQKKVIEFAFNGNGQPSGYTIVGGLSDAQRKAVIPGYDGVTKEDISKAKSLIQQAGLASGVTVDFVRGEGASYDDYQSVLQDMLRNIGITLKPVVMKYPAEVVPALVSRRYQAAYAPWVFTIIHPTSYLSVNVSNSADNRTGYSNPAYDAAYDKLLRAQSDSELLQISAQMEEMLARDRPWIPTQIFGGYIVARPNVRGFQGVGFIRDYYDLIYVWLAS